MAKIYKMKKDWLSVIGNANIGFPVKHNKGDLFYEEIEEDKNWPNGKVTYCIFYYPFKGGYPIWERDYGNDNPDSFYFVDEYLEFVSETDKPKEYFLNKKYSQSEVDKMLNNN